MNKYLYSLSLIAIASLNTELAYASNNITAKVVGSEVTWMNANVVGGEVVQQIWQPSSSFNLLPVHSWNPSFQKSPTSTLTFSSTTGVQVTAAFQHTGIQFSTASPFISVENKSNSCGYESSAGGQFILRDDSTCRASYDLNATRKYKPFDFYRSSYKLDNLVDAFKAANAPTGIYYAAVSLPVTYYMKYGTATTYQTYNDTTVFTIDYKPSFISAVDVTGDGIFSLSYDTGNHSVAGTTTYEVSISGHIEPGIKMQFFSSGTADKFELEHTTSSDVIPYSLACSRCVNSNIVEAGELKQTTSKIPFVGKTLDFDLVFSFEELYFGDVDEGDYRDAVTVRFELDL
ncbi:hypothetical protein BTO01_08865 [Vibrio jasicida]|uniref:hypothetical protein n=1 Tax=Vibrio jasicida TaxID=766224 RepID=UPI000CF47CA1|nr:hypothetical protein [Vibrio jasicida]PQJ71376.1 hypothetical protein BTO01_08865 [Vibrio jasicida]